MLLGITGLKSSGKSTVADYLVLEHGYEIGSFALPLKQSVSALFGITLEEIEEWKNDPACTVTLTRPNGMRSSMTLREFLQRYGTEAHRHVPAMGLDFWVNLLGPSLHDRMVVPDVRFENEARIIRERGGRIIRVERQEVAGSGDTHESEWGVQADATIVNDGSLEELYDFVDALVAFPGVLSQQAT